MAIFSPANVWYQLDSVLSQATTYPGGSLMRWDGTKWTLSPLQTWNGATWQNHQFFRYASGWQRVKTLVSSHIPQYYMTPGYVASGYVEVQ